MKTKRILSILMVVVMLCSLFPTSAFAVEENPAAEPAAELVQELPKESPDAPEEPEEVLESLDNALEALPETPTNATPEPGVNTVASVTVDATTYYYDSFADAAADADNGVSTIVLMQNVATAYTLGATETLKVQLGSYTLTVNAPTGYLVATAEAEGVTTYTCTAAAASVTVGEATTGYATLDEAITAASLASKADSGTAITVTLNNNVSFAEQIRVGDKTESSTYSNISVILNLNGKNITFTGDASTGTAKRLFIINRNATLTINGTGNVTSGEAADAYLAYFNYRASSTLIINGGNYTCSNAAPFQAYNSATDVLTSITSGSFNFNPAAYVPSGYEVYEIETGTLWGVRLQQDASYTINGVTTPCTNLAAALAAANIAGTTATITINKDASYTGPITVVGDLTLELNGKTLTNNTATPDSLFVVNGSLAINDAVGTGSITGANVLDAAGTGTVVINSGAYGFDPTSYLPEGYEAAENEGVWTIREIPGYWVVEVTIGETATQYHDLAAALASANAATSATVKLLENISCAGPLSITGDVTLNLNKKTLTDTTAEPAAGYSLFSVSGQLAVSGNTGSAIVGSSIFAVTGTGAIEISGGTYDAAPDAAFLKSGYMAEENESQKWTVKAVYAEVTKGGVTTLYSSFTNAYNAANDITNASTLKLLKSVGTYTSARTVSADANITLDLNGFSITNSGSQNDTKGGVFLVSGTLTVKDTSEDGNGKLIGGASVADDKNGAVIYLNTTGTLTIEGGTIQKRSGASAVHASGNKTTGKYSSLYITGGTIDGGVTCGNKSQNVMQISGGSFSEDPSAYVVLGHKVSGSGPYTVAPIASTDTEAEVKIEQTNAPVLYDTFAKAFDEITNGTITLLSDQTVETAVTIASGSQLTVDLNGHTITNNGTQTDRNSAVFVASGNLTVKDSSEAGTGRLIGGESAGDTQRGTVLYANTGSVVTIESGTFEKKSGVSAINVYAATVAISGGTFLGEVLVANSSTGTITGGWFSAIVEDRQADGYVWRQVNEEAKAAAPWTVTNTKTGTIIYHENGGIASTLPANYAGEDSVYYVPGYTITRESRVATPVRKGYRFIAWNTEAAGTGTTYTAGAQVQFTGSLDLYAQWEEVTARPVTIGTEEYASVGEALYFANAGDELVLVEPVTETVTIEGGKSVTIDLHGNSIQGTRGSAITVNSGATLTIKDTVGNGYVYGEAQSSGGAVDNSGTFTLVSGALRGFAPNYGAGVYNKGVFTVTGGSITAVAKAEAEKSSTQAIYSTNASTSVTISDDCLITGTLGGKAERYTVTAGRFTEDPTSLIDTEAYCAYVQSGSTEYSVLPLGAKVYSATDTLGVGYPSFETALAAVTDFSAQTIRLYTDVADEYTLAEGDTIRIEKNGHTITVVAPYEFSVLTDDEVDDVVTYSCAVTTFTADLKVNGEVAATMTADEENAIITVYADGNAISAELFTCTVTEGDDLVTLTKNEQGTITVTPVDDGDITVVLSFTGDTLSRSVALSFTVETPRTDDSLSTVLKKLNGEVATSLKVDETGTITVFDGRRALAASQLDWTVSEGSTLVTLDKTTGNITAKDAGIVTVDIAVNDANRRSASLTFVIEDKNLKTASLEDCTDSENIKSISEITVDKSDAQANPRTPLTCTVKLTPETGFEISKVTALSSDAKIATVKAVKGSIDTFIVTLGTKNIGACSITFTPYAKVNGKDTAQIPVVLPVQISDYAPRVESTVTLNTYSTQPTYITAVESYDNAITDETVTVMNVDKKGVPTDKNDQITATYENGFVAIESKAAFTKGFNCVLVFTTDKGAFDVPLSVKVKNVYPKITAVQSVYKPYKDSTVEYQLTVSDGSAITDAVISVPGYNKSGLADYKLSISKAAGAAKYAASGTAALTLDGYRGTVNVKLAIKSVAKPSFALDYTAPIVRQSSNAPDQVFSFTVTDKNLKDTAANLTITAEAEGASVTAEGDGYKLTVPGAMLATAGKKTVKLTVEEGSLNSLLSYSFTVVAPTKVPAVKLKASSLTLNASYPEIAASTTYTVDQQNLAYSFNVNPVVAENAGLFTFTMKNGSLKAAIADSNVKAGTYKFSIAVKYGYQGTDESSWETAKPVALTVKVIKTAAALSFKASGKLDLISPESKLTLTPTIKNFATADYTITGVDVLDANGKLTAEHDEKNVYLKLNDASVGKQTYRLKLTIEDKEGESCVVTSGVLTANITQSALKVKADSTTATIYQSQSAERTVVYTIRTTSPAGAEIDSVAYGKLNAVLRRNLADAASKVSYSISEDGQVLKVYVTMGETRRVVSGKTYTLPLVINPVGDKTGKAAAKINLTLKVMP